MQISNGLNRCRTQAEQQRPFSDSSCIAAVCRIDVSDAIRSKLKANTVKYPIEKSKGSHLKYDQL